MICGICAALADYGVKNGLLAERDRRWAVNALLDALGVDVYTDEPAPAAPLWELLGAVCDDAAARGVIDGRPKSRETLSCRLMGVLTPRPSQVEERFRTLYRDAPEKATNYYHALGIATGYIRADLAAQNPQWVTDTQFGPLEITVNLTKPEKDPKDIAAALERQSAGGVPACLLCAENEGYSGRPGFAARQNHRLIALTLGSEPWALQYSPYVYYNEHCIVLNRTHKPMHIDRGNFSRLLEFVSLFPHYFVGSNADLPIVGGSILVHDHFQGGRHSFAMDRAPVEERFHVPDFEDVDCGVVRWPMTVLRLRGAQPARLADLAGVILETWQGYSDPARQLFAETGGVPHHTITPIARRRGNDFELDLVLRSNLTSEEFPLGVYHPHPELHHIKKENIGLIEVMGLAVLPGRLSAEMAALREQMLAGVLDPNDPATGKHTDWAKHILETRPDFNSRTADAVLREEIGQVFAQVLEQCAVFRRDADGRAGLAQFLEAAGKRAALK